MIPLPAAFSRFALALHGLLCLRLSPLFSIKVKAIRCIEGFDGFVTSSIAPTATDWSDPSSGGAYTR